MTVCTVNWLRFLAVVLLIVLVTAGATVVHGRLARRWGDGPDVTEARMRLESTPVRLPGWELRREAPLDEAVIQVLECRGHLYREYVQESSGDVAVAAVLFGPKGPIAVHTPEVCYSAQAYEQVSPRKRTTLVIDGEEHSFWQVAFRSRETGLEPLEVLYGWSDGGAWQAAEAPRLWQSTHLYKLQVAVRSRGDSAPRGEVFLEALIPALNPQLTSFEGEASLASLWSQE